MALESTAIPGTGGRAAEHSRHRIAVRLLPFLFLLYVTNYLDRVSVAYAALGMTRDLGFSDRVFGMGAGVFFISYLALQIPGALLVERWSAHRLISGCLVAWGSLTMLTGLVHTPGQLYLARFVLGAAEAAFFPGVIVYLSHWFLREDRAQATAKFMAAIPLSLMIGSPIAGGILSHRWLGLEGWRWLFFLEGLPAVLLGAVAFFSLTDWPRQAHWLEPAERQWIEQRLEEERPTRAQAFGVAKALRAPAVLLLSSVTLFEYFMGYTVIFWLPTILKRVSALSDARVGWLGAIPYAAALVAMLVNGWHSDRSGERYWHSAGPVFGAMLALAALLVLPTSTALTVVVFSLVSMAYSAFLASFWAIPTEILSGVGAAAAVGLINGVGNIAGFAGPYAFGYLSTRTGSFAYGLASLAVASGVAGALVLLAPRVGGRATRRQGQRTSATKRS